MQMSDTPTKRKKPKHILKDLDVREVSLVSRPAIGRTYLLMKAADEVGIEMDNDATLEYSEKELEAYLDENFAEYVDTEKAATKREQGYDFPKAAYAYTPTDKPSTWKLRLWETPQKKVTRRQVGMAIAALGKGFRGRKVQIPAADLAKVKAKVRAAWRSVHSGDDEMPAVLKSETMPAGTPPAGTGVETMKEKLVELLKSAELADEARDAITGALNTLVDSEVPEEVMKSFYELAGYEVPEKEVVKEVEKIVEVEKKAEDETEEEEVLKGLDDKAQALFKEQKERIERAEKAAKAAAEAAEAERQARITREFVQKAAEEFSELPFKAEELGQVLKAIEEKLDENEAKVVMKVFATAKGAIKLTNQDKDLGVSGAVNEGAGPAPEYIKRAKAMVEKGEASTEAQAIAKLYDTEPELFLED